MSNFKKIVIKWNAVPIHDLKRYEVLVDTAATFDVDPKTFKTRATQFTWEEGATGTTYYMKVRAINGIEIPGSYSSTVNTSTGQIVTGDITDVNVTTAKIADNATAVPVSTYVEGAQTIANSPTWTAVGTIDVTASGAPIVLTFCVRLVSTAAGRIAMRIWRINGTDHQVHPTSGYIECRSVTNGNLVTFLYSETPAADVYTYRVDMYKIAGASVPSATHRVFTAHETKK